MSTSGRFFDSAPGSREIADRFADLHPPFTSASAVIEANRCLYCFDAPCMAACPTHIDVPKFIKKIASGNLEGSARTILDANILGASCARACPVQVLCEGSCVMHHSHERPIEIGRLQRFAMDALYASGAPLPFAPGGDTGRKVALIGGGPASLACAAELRRRGIRAEIFDARPLPGGLNTYGIAEYKLPLAESLREIDMLSQLGVQFHFETTVDATKFSTLEAEFDAVFLGVGLGKIQSLGVTGERLAGVVDALDFIAGYKTEATTSVPSGVAVIGAGNTAIDAANAAVRLGAEEVYLVYRRGRAEMSAFDFEYEHAQQEGVRFHWYKGVASMEGSDKVESIHVRPLAPNTGGLVATEAEQGFHVAVGMVILAIGQETHTGFLDDGAVKLDKGRIVINRLNGQTSKANVFAGGDCANGGREVVDAVADGKRAGAGIAAWLEGNDANA